MRIGSWTTVGRVLNHRWLGVTLDDLIQFGLYTIVCEFM